MRGSYGCVSLEAEWSPRNRAFSVRRRANSNSALSARAVAACVSARCRPAASFSMALPPIASEGTIGMHVDLLSKADRQRNARVRRDQGEPCPGRTEYVIAARKPDWVRSSIFV